MKTSVLSAAAAALLLTTASAAGYNHPEIHWKSVTTDHFVINFYDKTEPAVYATWKIAEATYESLSRLYEFTPDQKIVLSLASYDDESNGWSSWLEGAVLILLPDARFDLRGNTTWLRQVITHELTHHFSLSKRRRTQVLDWTVGLGYTSPQASVTLAEPIPMMTFYPSWLAEGVAQAGSDYLHSDCWDTRRDMVLRCAVLSKATLSLDAMGVFNHDARGNEMVYNQGYSLVRYIEQRFGRERLAGIMKDGATDRIDINAYVKLKTGFSLSQIYDSWLDSLRTTYSRAVPAETTPLVSRWNKGVSSTRPRWSADGKRWGCLTNEGDDGDRTDLIVFDTRTNRQIARIAYAQTSWDFSPDGNLVYYIRGDLPDGQGSYLNDLFVRNLKTGGNRRLTRDGRIYDVAVSPTGKEILVTRFARGAFSLDLFSIDAKQFTTVLGGEIGSPFVGPCFDPNDPNRVAVARIAAGHSQLYLVDIAQKSLHTIAESPVQEESPCWSRDGRIYFSADFGGIFNLYSFNPDSGLDLIRHSNVAGGLFEPSAGAPGELLGSEYTSSGFGIVSLPGSGIAFSFDSNTAACPFDSLPHPHGKVRIDSREYQSKMLRPYSELLTFAQVARGDSALSGSSISGSGGFGITIHREDALARKSLDLSLVLEVVGASFDSSSTVAPGGYSSPMRSRWFGLPGLDRQPSFVPQRAGDRPFERCPPLADRTQIRVGASTDSSAANPQAEVVAMPSLMYQNSCMAPTIGIDVSAAAPMGIPLELDATPYLDWQVWRDVYLGVSPQISAGFTSGFAAAIPFWIEWMPSGYYNTDIGYNLAGLSDLYVFVTPLDLFTLQSIRATLGADGSIVHRDTSTSTENGFEAGLSFMHQFPLLRYASVGPALDAVYKSFSEPVSFSHSILEGDSRQYLTLTAGADLHVPLFRQINRGKSPYADALYATLAYRFQANVNESFLDDANMNDFWQVAGGNARRDSMMVATQTVSASIQLGLVRAYTFSLLPSLTISYEVLRQTFAFDAMLSF